MNKKLCVVQLESLLRYVRLMHKKQSNGLLEGDVLALEFAIKHLKGGRV